MTLTNYKSKTIHCKALFFIPDQLKTNSPKDDDHFFLGRSMKNLGVKDGFEIQLISYHWSQSLEGTPLERLLFKGIDAIAIYLDLRSQFLRSSLTLIDQTEKKLQNFGYHPQSLISLMVAVHGNKPDAIRTSDLAPILTWPADYLLECDKIESNIYERSYSVLRDGIMKRIGSADKKGIPSK